MISSLSSSLRVAMVVALAGPLAGCARDEPDPPWVPAALEGMHVTQVGVDDHGYSSSIFVSHGLVLSADGTLLPFDAIEGATSPEVRPSSSDPVRSISSGDCAVFADDTARCIEDGAWSVVATGVSQLVPATVVTTSNASETIECVVTTAGALLCGAAHEHGAMFDGIALDAGGHTFARVAIGGAAICGITDEGLARCWLGSNDAGADLSLSGVVEIAIGSFHACALLDDGTARCWGDNSQGQLGAGNTDASGDLVTVVGLTDAVEIVASGLHTCARKADGSVVCWGFSGALVDRSTAERALPQPIPNVTGALDIFASDPVDCAATESGETRCWGTVRRVGIEPVSPPSFEFFIPGS